MSMSILLRIKGSALHPSLRHYTPPRLTLALAPRIIAFACLSSPSPSPSTQLAKTNDPRYSIEFKTLGGCKLGISRYPDFEYDAQGGLGKGVAYENTMSILDEEDVSVCFDPKELYIPALESKTTRFLGLPLPPFLKIVIIPEIFQGRINRQSGQVELEFKARFCFSVGNIYRAPPLLVGTMLTTDESIGKMRRGKGHKLDDKGNCKLVGVALVEPINDLFMNTFLQLPTECLADLSAVISFSDC